MTYRLPVAALILCSALSAQADRPPQFEVASLKLSAAGSGGGFQQSVCGGGPGSKDPELFRCASFTLLSYIVHAYQVSGLNVVGPDWLNSARFDVVAKVPPGATKEQFYLMLQDLLFKRLKVEAHREQREKPVYVLKLVDRRKLKDWVEPPPGQERPQSGAWSAEDGGAMRRMAGWTMEHAAAFFSVALSRPVIDETGLAGAFDMTLHYFLDGDDRGPSLTEAVREQLGLNLESAKRPTDVLVVDHAERTPSEN